MARKNLSDNNYVKQSVLQLFYFQQILNDEWSSSILNFYKMNYPSS